MYANADSEHAANTAGTCLQGANILPSQLPLPSLPSNAQYTFHHNKCFDWGTFGWALSKPTINASSYNYIVFMNSSIRGPFLPAYWPVSFMKSSPGKYECICCVSIVGHLS